MYIHTISRALLFSLNTRSIRASKHTTEPNKIHTFITTTISLYMQWEWLDVRRSIYNKYIYMNCLRTSRNHWKWSSFSVQYNSKGKSMCAHISRTHTQIHVYTHPHTHSNSIVVENFPSCRRRLSETCWRWLTTISPKGDKETWELRARSSLAMIIDYFIWSVKCVCNQPKIAHETEKKFVMLFVCVCVCLEVHRSSNGNIKTE